MSDNNTPEEIQQGLAGMAKATDQSTASLERQVKQMDAMTQTTKSLGQKFDAMATGLTGIAGKLKEGSEKTSAYNDAIGKGGDALAKFAAGFNPVLGTLVKGATEYVKAVNKQSDALYSSYKDISRIGATGASGLTGVYDSMKKLGYGVDQLGEMQSLLSDSATSLASLSGTVAEGTQAIATTSKEIRNSDIGNKFLTMGISVDNMNKGIVSYLKIQTQVGQAQRMTAEELRAGAAQYIESADKLTKITGLGLQQQQAVEQKALAEDMFGAYADRMRKEGKGGDVDEVLTISKMLAAQGGAGENVAQAIRDIKSGAIQTDAAQSLVRSIPDIIQVVQKQGATADEISAKLVQGSAQLRDQMGRSREIIGSAGFLKQSELQAIDQSFKVAGDKTVSERIADAAVGQGVTDKPTKNLTDFATSTRDARDNMQDLVQRGIEPVTKSMAFLADKTAKVSGMPGELMGKNLGGNYVGKGPGGFLGGTPGTPVGPISPSKINPSANFKQQAPQVMDRLMKDFNLTKEQAAGIVGNLGHESAGLQAGIQEGKPMGGGRGGLGWAQWTGPRRVAFEKYLKETGQSATDPNANYGFLKQELQTTHASSLSSLKKTGNVQDATVAFEKSYEGAGIKHYDKRLGYANEALASVSGPTSGRQGVPITDAVQTVGTKPVSENASNKAANGDDANQRVQAMLLETQDRQLAQLERLNRTTDKMRAAGT